MNNEKQQVVNYLTKEVLEWQINCQGFSQSSTNSTVDQILAHYKSLILNKIEKGG